MKNMDVQQREALQSLQRLAPQWALFIAWMQQNRSRVLMECARADDDIHVRRLQGQEHVLAEMLEALVPKP